MNNSAKTVFAFMHGGAMGPWVWEKIKPLFEYPCVMTTRNNILPSKPGLKINSDDIINHVVRQIDGAAFENVVLIAHSGSGVIAPQVSARVSAKVKHIIYIAANLPPQSKSALDMLPLMPRIMNTIMINLMPRGYKMPQKNYEKVIRKYFCNDCNEEIIQYALSNPFVTEPPAIAYYKVDYKGMPDVPRTYIRTLLDKTLKIEKQKMMAEQAGCSIIDFDTGHMPMLSKPAEFAGLINKIA